MAKKKILLIDDEPSVTKMLKRRLESEQFEVLTAMDGNEGYDAAAAQRPDLIITDVMMPKMDGYSFVKKLRADDALKHIPVIVLTAKDATKDLFWFEGVKDCDYIVKPFEAEHLMKKIAELLAAVKRHLDPERPS